MSSVTLVPPSLDSPCMAFNVLRWRSSVEELHVAHFYLKAKQAPVHDSQIDPLDCVNGLVAAVVALLGVGADACACACAKLAVVMISSNDMTPKVVPAELDTPSDITRKTGCGWSCDTLK